jgi:DNA-binding NarL/FixJ family response regulator
MLTSISSLTSATPTRRELLALMAEGRSNHGISEEARAQPEHCRTHVNAAALHISARKREETRR